MAHRRSTRRERIAVPIPTVLAVASLNLFRRTPVPAWPRITARETVVGRIAVEQKPCRAGLLRGEELHRPMTLAVARDDDLPRDVYAERRELRVVGRQSIVRVDDRRGDISRGRVGDEPASSARSRREPAAE